MIWRSVIYARLNESSDYKAYLITKGFSFFTLNSLVLAIEQQHKKLID